jgi:hypothetical protein
MNPSSALFSVPETIELADYMFTTFAQAINHLPPAPYALAFDITFAQDDLRCPVVRLFANYETYAISKYPENNPNGKWRASSHLEAIWGSAIWEMRTLATVGNQSAGEGSFEGDYVDEKGMALRKKWVQALGLWYEDELENTNFDQAFEIGGKIIPLFDDLCLSVARRLHPVVIEHFQTDLPILFFNGEGNSDMETVSLALLANPSALLKGYGEFLRETAGVEYENFVMQDFDKENYTYTSFCQEENC